MYQYSQNEEAYEDIKSLSDDDNDDSNEEFKINPLYSPLSKSQKFQLQTEGYCIMDPVISNDKITNLCNGYIRMNETRNKLIGIPGIILNIMKYCQGRYDPKYYVELQSGGQNPGYYLLPKPSINISKLLTSRVDIMMDTHTTIEVRQVPPSTLHAVCMYLGHHKGKEPDPLPCPVRSIHMNQIVSDQWDATWIDAFDKKTIFEVILAANYMDIKSLLHLGCAKIATLIKQLDQREINRIIEEEERYRRDNQIKYDE